MIELNDEHEHSPVPSGNADRLRAAALAASMILQFAVGILGGIGLRTESVGTVADSYPNPLLPAGTAFSIWTLIYVATIITAIRHGLPSQYRRDIQRAVGWKLAAAGVLNAAWILAFSNRWILLAQIIIVGLLILLALTYRATTAHKSSGAADRLTIHLPVAVYTGWVSAATVVGLITTITAGGTTVTATAAIVLLAAATVLIAAATWCADAKAGYAAAVVWALLWIAAEAETTISATSIACAGVVIAAVAVSTWRSRDHTGSLLG